MMDGVKKILIIGYGNPGRLDDGIGPYFAGLVEERALPGVTVDADYQLTVEDAANVAEHDVVIFADASLEGKEPFFFEEVRPGDPNSFTTHSVEPPAVMALAHDLFDAETEGYVLGIRGYEFDEFGEKLSSRARKNVEKALDFILDFVGKNTVSPKK
ncbi:MAG: hydrogenase maturation protease [Candidatus Omnitrophica bacterium]|nr:hydrogenase maturation protease [Candidatus Omnitrophota bacterium]MDD5487732.1 hydrogenase maturation protease [Candidatus Omnitrophota bacterium]